MYSGAYFYFILICVDVTVELFGSSLSGFALKESDVNINLNYPAQEDEKTNVSLKKLVRLGCIAGRSRRIHKGFHSPNVSAAAHTTEKGSSQLPKRLLNKTLWLVNPARLTSSYCQCMECIAKH